MRPPQFSQPEGLSFLPVPRARARVHGVEAIASSFPTTQWWLVVWWVPGVGGLMREHEITERSDVTR